MPQHDIGRRCRQCGTDIRWIAAHFVGSRTFCGKPCALVWLTEMAARTGWRLAVLKMQDGPHDFRWRARVAWIGGHAWIAQRRLNRRLSSHAHDRRLPWLWLPSWRGAAALLLVVAACGLSGGRPPNDRAMISASEAPSQSLRVESGTGSAKAVVPAPAAVRHMSAFPDLPRPPVAPPAATPTPLHANAMPRRQANDLARGDVSLRQIAFTFDGGSEANVTGEILDALRSQNVRCTMFLTGQFVRTYPEWVRRMIADGHEIGNHLDTHPHLTTYDVNRRQHTLPTVTKEFLFGQLRRADDSFRTVVGAPMAPFWRAPYGEHNGEIRAWAEEAGYAHISWTRGAGTAEDLDTRDWVADRSSRIYHSRDEIAQRLLAFGGGRPEGLNGGIVLMHLGTQRRTDRPHESLRLILGTLQDRGYQLVTISQLLQYPAATTAAAPEASPSDTRDAR